jgi:acyl carrier protein
MDRRQFALFGTWIGARLQAQVVPRKAAPGSKGRVYEDREVAPIVKKIIAEKLNVDEAKVRDTASFEKDLGADSLDIVEIVLALEDAFSIHTTDEEAEQLKIVRDAIDCVKKHLRTSKRLSSGRK